MRFGLEKHIVESIISVFEEHSKVDKAYVFGSRAKGNYRPDSDIDIAIKGQELTTDDIISMAVAFEAEGVTYKIDLIDYNNIKEPELRAHIDRVGIEFYSRWKEYTLGEITHKITDGAHLSPKDYPNGKIMFSVKDMTETGFDYSSPKTISQEDFENLIKQGCQPDIDDVLIAKDGSVLKHIFRVTTKPDYVLLSSIAIVKPKKEIVNASFLVYTLKNPKITETILNNFVSGSGVPRIVLKDFKKVNISLPPLSEQRAISSILSSLEDKIDLLQRQNKTLEQLAETLFRQLFIEEAEESWEIVKLNDVITIKGGTTPSTSNSEFWNGTINWTSPKDLSNASSIFLFDTERKITEKGLKEIGSGLLPIGTVLLSSRAPIGYLSITTIPVAINQGYIAIICDKILSNYFMFLWCKLNMEIIENAGNGSVFQEISKSSFKGLEIILPPKERLKDFDNTADSLFSKIKSNQIQIRALTKTRDSLLPKLMSGEVRATELNTVTY
jgi:type I restriction enzyme S subunit